MLLTPEKSTHRTETTCTCGSKVKFQVNKRDFFVGPRRIIIDNLPHFYCSYCDKAIFDSALPIDDLLKHAIKNNMSIIDWENRSLHL